MKTWIYAVVASSALAFPDAQASGPLPSGSFTMLNSDVSCAVEAAPTCYMTQADQAAKVVANLRKVGVEYFMIPSASLSEATLLGTSVDQAGGKFLSYERWAFESAAETGTFNCNRYTQERIIPFLIPLKIRFPQSFFGLQLKDEAPLSDHENLGALVQCIRNSPKISDLKVFVNLVGVNANAAALYGPGNGQVADTEAPTEYGIDCQSNTVVDRVKFNALNDRYTSYVISALEKVKPDYLAFDFYPFNGGMDGCPAAREQLMTANMSIVAQQANARGVVPIAYLQNYQQANILHVNDARHASFHELRWFSAWFYLFGGRGTANFISHDFDQGKSLGLLDINNDPRDLAVEQQSVFGFTHQIQDAVKEYEYLGFVAPWLSVPAGKVLGWLPSEHIMAAEFHRQSDGSDILIFVRRQDVPLAAVTTGLNKWWSRIQRLNLWTGLWETVGTGTNAITVGFDDMPAVIYRLSD
ncbi:hypothetical protein P3W33_12455 [Luteibacter sp. PPL552]